MNEWREIPGYEGLYAINRKGDVMSLRTGRWLHPYKMYDKWKLVALYDKNGRPDNWYIVTLLEYVGFRKPKHIAAS